MIFLTLGTTKFPFLRLLEAVDKALLDLAIKEKLIAQIGPNPPKFNFKNRQIYKELPFNKMIHYLSHSRVVITHGGVGTLLLALKYCQNKPLVVPRSKDWGEHVDDHQAFLAKFLNDKGLIEVAFPEDDLKVRIKKFLLVPQRLSFKKGREEAKQLIRKLIAYTERIGNEP